LGSTPSTTGSKVVLLHPKIRIKRTPGPQNHHPAIWLFSLPCVNLLSSQLSYSLL